ncbi:Transposable element Tc1 transposase [Labeo rohita]|uniref:Transposable element Tc1 transposase n=1 Tax=Labeo rohita TaxID=84645 RepID=A0ABQ8MEE5_LABRO|nr:Transposable element Tc1 transposase [Labeo rohita]
MVSQFGSLDYTIIGKTADLTVVQKTIIDTLHKEGKTQTFIAKEAGCSQSAPLLKHRQCQRRLTWAKKKEKWTVAQWSKVLFSDENKFCISFGNQGPRVWRKGGEAHSQSCLKSSVKFPQSVMIWGAMSSAGVGPLCFLKTKVTASVYQEILEHFMLPSADQLFKDADFIFQQDLVPAHTDIKLVRRLTLDV